MARRARTLDELATLTGVSRATVSRVINGGPVAPATKAKVQEVLQRVEYRPNLVARSLASGRTGVVGLVMHAPALALFTDPYWSLLLAGITETLADTATGLMLWLSHLSKRDTLDQILSTHFVDGIICTATILDDPLVDGLLSSDLPTVLIGHRRHDSTASYVDVDNESASEDVVAHLVQIGRRRIGHVTGSRGTVSGEDRLLGYNRALDRAGVEQRFVADGDYTIESGYEGAEQLLAMGVDAIFAGSDAMAAGAYQKIREHGLRIPDDIAVAGFDDVEFAADLDPPLTTVRQNVRSQGEMSARTLLRLLDKKDGGPRRVILPTELIIRQSTVGGVHLNG
jgi:DNA-binding LacI/PurR family transcriptional regulator